MAFSIESQTTQISNIFIDEYMPKAYPHYVLIYLYAYRHASSGNTSLTNAAIAEALDILESDVVKSWKYWQEQGIVEISENENVHFLPVQSKQYKKEKTINFKNTKISESPPQYTTEEIVAISKNSPTAKNLFSLAEQYLGRTIQYEDMVVVLSFNEWLKLPYEVIEMLFQYCANINYNNLKSIEKIACTWANEGITTPEKALEYIKLHQNGYKEIMKALGQNNIPTPAQQKYIEKWISEYHFSVEMIVIACEKTMLEIGKPKFSYVEKIIKNWYDNHIKTPEDVKISDEKFQYDKQNKKEEQNKLENKKKEYKNTPVKQNRFVNYEQREWDFEELERLARERLKKS